MKVRILSESKTELACWAVVKSFVCIVLVSLVVDPVTRSWSKTADSGLKTMLPAQIKTLKSSAVSIGFSAEVLKVYVTPGTKVEAGQVLAELDSREIREAVAMAKLRVSAAAEGVSDKGSLTQKSVLKEQTDTTVKNREMTLARLKNYSLEPAEQSLTQARHEYVKVQQLVQQQLATATELENVQKVAAMEERNYQAAKETWLRLKQEAEAADGQLRMVKLQAAGQEGAGSSSVSKLNYEEAQVALRQALQREAALRIIAPQAGVVLSVNLKVGELAAAWVPLIQIADLDRLEIDVPVTSKMAQSIKAGMPVNVVLPSEPPVKIAARVNEIAFVPDQNAQPHTVKILVRNPSGSTALVGLEASVEFGHGGGN